MTLTLLKNAGQVFGGMTHASQFGFVSCFLMIRLELYEFGEGYHRGETLLAFLFSKHTKLGSPRACVLAVSSAWSVYSLKYLHGWLLVFIFIDITAQMSLPKRVLPLFL